MRQEDQIDFNKLKQSISQLDEMKNQQTQKVDPKIFNDRIDNKLSGQDPFNEIIDDNNDLYPSSMFMSKNSLGSMLFTQPICDNNQQKSQLDLDNVYKSQQEFRDNYDHKIQAIFENLQQKDQELKNLSKQIENINERCELKINHLESTHLKQIKELEDKNKQLLEQLEYEKKQRKLEEEDQKRKLEEEEQKRRLEEEQKRRLEEEQKRKLEEEQKRKLEEQRKMEEEKRKLQEQKRKLLEQLENEKKQRALEKQSLSQRKKTTLNETFESFKSEFSKYSEDIEIKIKKQIRSDLIKDISELKQEHFDSPLNFLTLSLSLFDQAIVFPTFEKLKPLKNFKCKICEIEESNFPVFRCKECSKVTFYLCSSCLFLKPFHKHIFDKITVSPELKSKENILDNDKALKSKIIGEKCQQVEIKFGVQKEQEFKLTFQNIGTAKWTTNKFGVDCINRESDLTFYFCTLNKAVDKGENTEVLIKLTELDKYQRGNYYAVACMKDSGKKKFFGEPARFKIKIV